MARLLGAGMFVLAASSAIPTIAAAQSLAALAEQSGSRPAAQKTYTNADLDVVSAPEASPSTPSAPPPADAPVAPAAEEKSAPRSPLVIEEYAGGGGRVNVIAKVEKNQSAENEPYWRGVVKTVKNRIAKAEADLASIARSLETADDRERGRLMELQARTQRDLESLNAQYEGHVKRAQVLGVPQEWLR